jgi:hypothetical protein
MPLDQLAMFEPHLATSDCSGFEIVSHHQERYA